MIQIHIQIQIKSDLTWWAGFLWRRWRGPWAAAGETSTGRRWRSPPGPVSEPGGSYYRGSSWKHCLNPSNFESTFFLARAWGAATPVLSPGAENKSLTVILYYCLAYRVFYCLVYCVFNCLLYCVFHCVLYCDLLIDDLFIICTCSALGKGAEKKKTRKSVVFCQTRVGGLGG